MTKHKRLSKKQLAVIEDLFNGELDEQAVLDKNKVSRNMFNRWQGDENFIGQLESRIAAAHRQSAALIARYAPLAAAKLVRLTESEKEETARRACLDIISFPSQGGKKLPSPAQPQSADGDKSDQTVQLSEQLAAKLLAVLAEEKEQ